jgi:hypothetical protein
MASKELAGVPLARRLVPVLCSRTGVSSAGFPYLGAEAYAFFRDHVPHVLAMGSVAQNALSRAVPLAVAAAGDDAETLEQIQRAERVIRTMLNTAAITAPPDLWLLRFVLGTLQGLGVLDRLLTGQVLDPDACSVHIGADSEKVQLSAEEVEAALRFLATRRYVIESAEGYTIAPSERVRDVFTRVTPTPEFVPAGVGRTWKRLFEGAALDPHEIAILGRLGTPPRVRTETAQDEWTATLEEIELGYRIVPIVLGLRHAERTAALGRGAALRPTELSAAHPELVVGACEVLAAAGALVPGDGVYTPTAIGQRLFARGPGPFGIIETYHPYMSKLRSILLDARESVWVNRTANVLASQDANSKTFEQCNDSLDRFCADTGYSYDVFIEHALGRGEATRQRWQRSADRSLHYFGADLESAAIDAAVGERDAGNLPADMVFVRGADIGEPSGLVAQIRAAGVSTEGAVMMVGNGFHEIRNQTLEKMTRVFREYHDAGVLLLFTEANAMSVEDLRETAWNTYHAGFMYVHQLSGQGLRPAGALPDARARSPAGTCAWRRIAHARARRSRPRRKRATTQPSA